MGEEPVKVVRVLTQISAYTLLSYNAFYRYITALGKCGAMEVYIRKRKDWVWGSYCHPPFGAANFLPPSLLQREKKKRNE